VAGEVAQALARARRDRVRVRDPAAERPALELPQQHVDAVRIPLGLKKLVAMAIRIFLRIPLEEMRILLIESFDAGIARVREPALGAEDVVPRGRDGKLGVARQPEIE